jgi:beta-glucanase (GH16 family)
MMENFGAAFAESSVHTPDGGGVFTAAGNIPVEDGWHVWQTTWESSGFTFSRDASPYLTVTPGQLANWPFSPASRMRMILNLAVGGRVGTPPTSTPSRVSMLVDYVRVTQ